MKRLLIAPLVGAMLMLFAPIGHADMSYANMIVSQLNPGNHVVVDSGASPKLPNPSAINDQILQTGVPMYVVNVAKNQTTPNQEKADDVIWQALYDTHNPVTNPITVNGQLHKPPLMIVVIDANGYHAKSYDVTESIAAATGPAIRMAAVGHHGDLNGAVSAFVSAMANTPSSGSIISNAPQPPAPTNWAFAWGILWVLVGVVVLTAIGALVRLIYVGHKERTEKRNTVQDKINNAEADVNNLAEEVLKGEDVSGPQNRATDALANAKKALANGNIDNANSLVRIAIREIETAYRVLSPMPAESMPYYVPPAHVSAIKTVPKKDRKRATVTATSPKGNQVSIDNIDYRTRPTTGYRNYYKGGMHDGVYFYPGYYPYPFWASGWGWSPMDVILTDELLSNRHDARSDDGVYGSYSGGGSADYSESSGSHTSAATSAPYSPPSYHHSSSSDSGDYSGGGSSSFGGGFDFGGGGFSGDSSGGGSAGF